jgi:hypothetical protein
MLDNVPFTQNGRPLKSARPGVGTVSQIVGESDELELVEANHASLTSGAGGGRLILAIPSGGCDSHMSQTSSA